jgi:hypothetical protein
MLISDEINLSRRDAGAATKVTATRRVSVVRGIKQEKKEKE